MPHNLICLSAQERNIHLPQDGHPLPLNGAVLPIREGWYMALPTGGIIFFPQDDPEKEQDNPEDPVNSPYSSRESNVDIAASSSKEQGPEPEAISFLGALRIPVRCLWNEGKMASLVIFTSFEGTGC